MNLSDIMLLFSPGPRVSEYPKTVVIESTNACNLRCKMCHVWGEGVTRKREVGFITEHIWKGAIDELSSWDEPVTIALHGAGEPVLHKDFLKILSYAASKKNLAVGFLSNGSLWSKDFTKAVLDTDISWIGFSIDGADPVNYKKYRGGDLKKVESAVEYLISLRKNTTPRVFLNMVALPDLEQATYLERWIDKVDEVKISTYRPVGHRDFLTEHQKRIPCYLLNEMLIIAWNGKAVLCCEDIWADIIVGRFPERSLHEIWHSSKFNKIRKLHAKGKFNDIPLCATCDSWSNLFTREESDESRNLKIIKTAAQTCYLKTGNTNPQA